MMKKGIKVICTVLAMALVLTAVSPAAPAAKAAKKIKLNKKNVTLVKGKTVKLKVKGTKKKVTWKSSKKKVATVNKKGKVTAKKKGKATITAKVAGKKLKCKVTVKNPKKKVTDDKKNEKDDSKVTPAPNPTVVATNTAKLKDYILKNGTVDENGDRVITDTVEDDTDTLVEITYTITYRSASDNFLFSLSALGEDEESSAEMSVDMVVDLTRKSTVSPRILMFEDDIDGDTTLQCVTEMKAASYTSESTLTWKVEKLESTGMSEEELSEIRSLVSILSDQALLMGFIGWDELLTTKAGLSMKAIGFVSYVSQ